MEDGIPRGLQHHYKTCCKKDGRCKSTGLYVLEVVSLLGRYFWMGRLAYNT